jgi:hypothetical protein
MPVGFGSTR